MRSPQGADHRSGHAERADREVQLGAAGLGGGTSTFTSVALASPTATAVTLRGQQAKEETILVVSLSGRGDKDMEQARRLLAP